MMGSLLEDLCKGLFFLKKKHKEKTASLLPLATVISAHDT